MFRNSRRLKASNNVFNKYDRYDIPNRLATIRQNCNSIINLAEFNLKSSFESGIKGNNNNNNGIQGQLDKSFLVDTDEDSEEDTSHVITKQLSKDDVEPKYADLAKLIWSRTFEVWKNALTNVVRRKLARTSNARIHDLETVERCQNELQKLGPPPLLSASMNSEPIEQNERNLIELDSETEEAVANAALSSLIPVKFVVPGQGEVNRYIVKTSGNDYLDVTEIGLESKEDLVDRFLSARQEFKSMIFNKHCASLVWIFNEKTKIILLTESTKPDSWSPQQYYRYALSHMALLDSIMIGHPYYWHPGVRRKLTRTVKQFKKLYKAIDDRKALAKKHEERRKLRKEAVDFANANYIMPNDDDNDNEKPSCSSSTKKQEQRQLQLDSTTDSTSTIKVNTGSCQVIVELPPAVRNSSSHTTGDLVEEIYDKWSTKSNESITSIDLVYTKTDQMIKFIEEVNKECENDQNQKAMEHEKKKRFKYLHLNSNISQVIGEETDEDEEAEKTFMPGKDGKDPEDDNGGSGSNDSSKKGMVRWNEVKQPFNFEQCFPNFQQSSKTNKEDLSEMTELNSPGEVAAGHHTKRRHQIPKSTSSSGTSNTNPRQQIKRHHSSRSALVLKAFTMNSSSKEDLTPSSSSAEGLNQNERPQQQQQPQPTGSNYETGRSRSTAAIGLETSQSQNQPTQQRSTGFRFPRLSLAKYQPSETGSLPSLENVVVGPPVVSFNEPLLVPNAQAVEAGGAPVGDHFHHHHLHHHELLGHDFEIPPADADATSPINTKSLSDEDLSSMVTQLDLETSTYPSNLGKNFSHYGVQHHSANHHHPGDKPRWVSNLHSNSSRSRDFTDSSRLKPLDLTPAGTGTNSHAHVHSTHPPSNLRPTLHPNGNGTTTTTSPTSGSSQVHDVNGNVVVENNSQTQ